MGPWSFLLPFVFLTQRFLSERPLDVPVAKASGSFACPHAGGWRKSAARVGVGANPDIDKRVRNWVSMYVAQLNHYFREIQILHRIQNGCSRPTSRQQIIFWLGRPARAASSVEAVWSACLAFDAHAMYLLFSAIVSGVARDSLLVHYFFFTFYVVCTCRLLLVCHTMPLACFCTW